MIALKEILVATDFSESADLALAYGRRLARSYGAALHVLHVIEDIAGQTTALPGRFASVDRVQQQMEAEARRQLEALIGDDHRQGLHAEGVVVTSVAPAQTILAYAALHKIDLIILGRNGHAGGPQLFMGNVAQHVVRLATCPVLTMRHPTRSHYRPDVLQRSPDMRPGAVA